MEDCNYCPYKKWCEEIEIKDLTCEEIKQIAESENANSGEVE
jgi:2-iminoacetate synthase ThiH